METSDPALHAQARQLAEHGGDRDRRSQQAMHQGTRFFCGSSGTESGSVGTETKQKAMHDQLEVHKEEGPESIPHPLSNQT